jgi:hypothetical protein
MEYMKEKIKRKYWNNMEDKWKAICIATNDDVLRDYELNGFM